MTKAFEPRVTLITLGVADIARSRAFQETGLGWKASSESQDDVEAPLALGSSSKAARSE
jgi:hypothetical protein